MNIKPGTQTLLLSLCSMLALYTVAQAADQPAHNFDRWEKSIAQFEKQDKAQGIQEDGILFVGSSSIRMWDLKKYFPELPVINRGFGGSEIVDSTHFADRIILKHKPKVIFLYAGDNDIARGRTAKEVAGDFKQFVSVVHKALPETRIVFIAVKPSLSRWKLAGTMQEANKLIKKQCEKTRLSGVRRCLGSNAGRRRQTPSRALQKGWPAHGTRRLPDLEESGRTLYPPELITFPILLS